jgi:uncharacterized protein YceH (UPF0502 family)/SAM-dependent methyltransferase
MARVDHEDITTVELNTVEQRVVGSLMEKQVTVPATYPMTLNALRTACNQSSSRDPVTDLDDLTIETAIGDLKAKGVARIVHAGSGARMPKYRQVLDDVLELAPDEKALLTVLLLRGPQAAGELKTRTERLHGFADRSEVEACLGRLASRPTPLAKELERQAGQHDTRWIHLLGPVDLTSAATSSGRGAAPAAPEIDRETVLADGPVARDSKVVATYDAVASTYADQFVDELEGKPFDRWLLERIADLADGGPVAEAGCGPGHVTFHLAAAGADVTGYDLTPGMVAEARRRFPEIAFEQADLTDLPPPAEGSPGWAAITAWYSLVHLAGSEVRPAVALMARALRPGGWLAVALHVGDGPHHLDDLLGHEVDITFMLHDLHEVVGAFPTAGLVDVEWYHRGPKPPESTERLYVLGRRPER